MSNLRIKLKYKSFEIELEGDQETVKNEFHDIKQNGLGNIVNGVDMSENYYIEANEEKDTKKLPSVETVDFEEKDALPALREIVLKQLPSSETEWILIYAFYSTSYATKSFNLNDIISMYESTKRLTASHRSNLSNNIKSLFRKGYLAAQNEDDYLVSEDGVNHAREILNRTHSITSRSNSSKKKPNVKIPAEKKRNKKSTSKKADSLEVIDDLNLRPQGEESIFDFFQKYEVKSLADKIILTITYLQDVLQIEKISINHIYTALYILKERIPASFKQVVINVKNRKKFIKYDTLDDIQLTTIGSNRVRIDITK
ncbi:hypothetical protein [Autumnicola edwardsiae]|uniref:Uncharacterized protein n=1 Tax=Autumnicola edwardsiae TaxID=3075594 RepID=A0ABU3CYV6_9FLAO|nr:hypothetical protein [Zunongwangia sp. F297]MDT0651560.1 hypothetical protein [Zunongwangia sp. F297]